MLKDYGDLVTNIIDNVLVWEGERRRLAINGRYVEAKIQGSTNYICLCLLLLGM
jgi:hypothetical protein